MVAATDAGAASIRFMAPKNKRFAAMTDPAASPSKPRQAAPDGGAVGALPQIASAIQIRMTPPTASRNKTFTTP